MRTKIFLVESGIYEQGIKDLSIAYKDEQKAWLYSIKKFKKYHLERKRWEKRKGFRGILFGKNRWIAITEIILKD